jgi:hypothetical protein
MWELHYLLKLRPTGISVNLVFGIAIDLAVNDLDVNKDLDKAIEIFRNAFKYENMNDVIMNDDDSDIEESIIDQEMYDKSKEFSKPKHWLAWACLRTIGRMLLEKYYKDILPLIEEVEGVQIELSGRPGIIDKIVKLRGHGRVLLDNKTSNRPYADNAPSSSTQLALYCKDKGIKKAGFIVFNKKLQNNTRKICLKCGYDGSFVRHETCPKDNNGKRCKGDWQKTYKPEAVIQLLVEDIPDVNKDLIESSISAVEKGIEASIYPRNLKACGKIYGKPCPYIKYCWNDSKEGLEYKTKEEEENE